MQEDERDRLAAAHRALAERFDPIAADGLRARFVVELRDLGGATITIAPGRCTIEPVARASRAEVVFTTEVAVWLDLIGGRVRGMDAFLAGELEVAGDLHLATRFETLFRRREGQPRVEVTRTHVRGVGLEALVAGTGEPVVLLHGLGANKVSFLPTVAALAEHAEVHALDLPGFGRSDRPLPVGRRYTLAWFADMVNGYLIERGLGAVHLIGNSLGGRIALEVALRHPRSVHSIVGLGPALGFDLLRPLTPVLHLAPAHWSGLAPLPLPRATVEQVVRGLFADPDVLPEAHHRAAADDVMDAWRHPSQRLALLATARQLGLEPSRGRRAYWRRVAGLSVPSYWIFGDADRLVASRYAARVTSALPGATVETWHGVGHVPQFEAPARTTDALLRWLGTHTGAGVVPPSGVPHHLGVAVQATSARGPSSQSVIVAT